MVTSPQRSLLPAGGDDRGSLLCTLEVVACSRLQFAEVVRTVVGHGVTLEPGPQILHWIEVWCVGRQVGDLDMPVQAVDVVAYKVAVVRPCTIPDHQQGLFQMAFERLEELDKLFLLDAAFVNSEQAVGSCQSSDDRDVVPVEVKLDDRCLPLGCPGTHTRGPLADARFVDKDDQSSLSLGFFLRAGHLLRFQLRTTSSLRSIARLSGFCGLKPSEPRMRQI